jgi:hypothetical protein
MQREIVLSLSAAILASAGTLGFQETTRSFVVNLQDPHPIEGTVVVPTPIPHSKVVSFTDIVVAPATGGETGLWTGAGSLDTSGFTSVVLSLHGQLRGSPTARGVVAVALVPEEENILRAFAEGEVHLALEARADPVPSGGFYFSGSAAGLPVAFPQYRIFLYNTTDRSAAVNVFAYLTN